MQCALLQASPPKSVSCARFFACSNASYPESIPQGRVTEQSRFEAEHQVALTQGCFYLYTSQSNFLRPHYTRADRRVWTPLRE